MKKILLLGVVLFLVKATFAQRGVNFGLKGGLNFSNLKDDSRNTDSRTLWHAGALAHIHVSKRFAIQPELVYSAQGAQYANDVNLNLHYVNIPVLAQYMFGDGFRLQTGPQLGILANSDLKIGSTETDIDGDAIKNFDFAWSFGTSYVTKSGLGIDGRYNLGLRDVSEANPDLKNRVWQVGLFYQFRH